MSMNAPATYGPEPCATCKGTGKPAIGSKAAAADNSCLVCKGQGRVMVALPSKKCPQCGGTGELIDKGQSKECYFCGASGWSLTWKPN
jgi:DnaJ-class molecular chaperone